MGSQRLFLAASFPSRGPNLSVLPRGPLVSSILTVCADKDELTGLLSVTPVTSQR